MKYLILVIVILSAAYFGLGSLYDRLNAQTPVSEQSLMANALDPELPEGEFHGQKVPVPGITSSPAAAPVLGSTSDLKRIEIDLSQQRLYAYEGDQIVYNFLISSGKWGRTPTGTFEIWAKVRSTKMEGGSKALRTYYYLPKVPYTMFFYNDEIPKARGYGIHGAYWHNNFGHPMSHGCVNMKPEEAGLLYQWAEPEVPDNAKWHFIKKDTPSTPIIIYGTTPR